MDVKNAVDRVAPVFELPQDVNVPLGRKLWPMLRPRVEDLLGLRDLERVVRRIPDPTNIEAVVTGALEVLGIRYDLSDLDAARVPANGPCLVVANHPFGAAEGLVLARLLLRRRRDVRMVANPLLGRIAGLRDLFLFVDPFGDRASTHGNARSLRQGVAWLKDGGILAMFPAGEVAAFDGRLGRIVEPSWSRAVASLVRHAEVPVLPIHFSGTNSALFHGLGLVHPRLRTALLVHELLNKRGRSLRVHVGSLLSSKRLSDFRSDSDLVGYVRHRTFMLGERGVSRRPLGLRREEAIVGPVPSSLLEQDLRSLHGHQLLHVQGEVSVFVARARQIPHLLREIGRLREGSFRAAGEGTGRSIDLDEFDRTYLHLFAWDRAARAIVGAYRLGPTDEILAAEGLSGLYTSSLFRMRPELFAQMGPALEMGRSFVREANRRSASGLYALWRGIGAFVARNPKYRHLYGPVSISASYSRRSHELVVQFMRQHNHMHPWEHLVRPRHPFTARRTISIENGLPLTALADDVEEISKMVVDLEPDHKGLPVLLRQYLRLGGKMLAFNVDPNFNRTLDGLVVVDLIQADVKLLERYLGCGETEAFLSHHRPSFRDAG